MLPTIFALGTASAENRTINRYIASLTEKSAPRICFIGTAAGEPPSYFEMAQRGFSELASEVVELSFFRPPTADLRGFLGEFDCIYVGGGNTKSLLALWREWGVDKILYDLWQSGKVLCGVSAGCICWFDQGITDSIPGPFTALPCLGFIPDVCCPHFGDEPERRPTFHRMISAGQFSSGIGVDANCGLLYRGTRLVDIVSATPGAQAYRLEREGTQAIETALVPTVLLT